MPEGAIRIETRDGVNLVRMDDGKVNALSLAFLEELGEALDDATEDKKPVVLTGNGEAFSAGLDLTEVPTLDEEGLRALFTNFEDVLSPVLTAPVPVVAAIEGFAIAGGAIIALACDHRVASIDAEIGATELNLGIPFPPTDLELFQARLPTATIRRTILDPQRCHGEQALELGWVDELSAEPVQDALSAANRVGGPNPLAFQDLKRQLNQPVVEALEAFGQAEAERYVEMLTSKTSQQAILEGIEDVLG